MNRTLLHLWLVGALSYGTARAGEDELDRLLRREGNRQGNPVLMMREMEETRQSFAQAAETETVTPKAALLLARNGQIDDALAMMAQCLARENLTPTERAKLLFQTAQLFDPLVGLPRAADFRQQAIRMRQMVEWLQKAAQERAAEKPVRWTILTTLCRTGLDLREGEPLRAAAEAAEAMMQMDDLTPLERWTAHEFRVRIAQLRADYPTLAKCLAEAIPAAIGVEDRARLQLWLGDIAVTFLGAPETAAAQWREVAENEAAHPYFRAIAMEKLALLSVYRLPHPTHVLAPFPERKPVEEDRAAPERLAEALGWWRRVLTLPLANWVKLDAGVGMARACQSCGRSEEGLKILKTEVLVLPGLHPRQEAELYLIAAELALASGDRTEVLALLRRAESVSHARPALLRAARAFREQLENQP